MTELVRIEVFFGPFLERKWCRFARNDVEGLESICIVRFSNSCIAPCSKFLTKGAVYKAGRGKWCTADIVVLYLFLPVVHCRIQTSFKSAHPCRH